MAIEKGWSVVTLFILSAIVLCALAMRMKGSEGFAFFGRLLVAALLAVPLLSYSFWLASFVLGLSFWGVSISHNKWFNLKSAEDWLCLAGTGFAVTAGACVAHLYIGNTFVAAGLFIAGAAKPAAYYVAIRYEAARGINRDHLPVSEILQGAIIGLALVPAYWGLLS